MLKPKGLLSAAKLNPRPIGVIPQLGVKDGERSSQRQKTVETENRWSNRRGKDDSGLVHPLYATRYRQASAPQPAVCKLRNVERRHCKLVFFSVAAVVLKDKGTKWKGETLARLAS